MCLDLNNHKSKCRFCFQSIRSVRKSVGLTDEIRQKFFDFTNFELISSVEYSSVVCKPCLAGIDERLKYKEHLVENQKYLYSKIYPHELVSIKEEPTETFTIKTEMRTCEVSSVKTEPCEPSEFSNDAEYFEPEPSSPTSEDHIKCEICSKMLKTGATFKRHQQFCCKNLPIKESNKKPADKVHCQYCSKLLSKFKVKCHEKVHENEMNNIFYQCDHCSFKSPNRENMNNHAKKHFKYVEASEVKVFQNKITPVKTNVHRVTCRYCSKVLSRKKIKNHETVHENIINNIFLQCDQCNFKTRAKENINNHVKKHFTFQDIADIACRFCSKVYANKQYRVQHEKTHLMPTGEFPCDTCGTICTTKLRLTHHIKTHHVFGSFHCKHCSEVFENRGLLSNHFRHNHRVTVFVTCEVCGKILSKDNFTKHIAVCHQKIIKCPFEDCNKNFFSKTGVARHFKNYHEESKHVKCPQCASVFQNEGKLKRHISRSHKASSFFCEVEGCSYKQTRKEYLRLHLSNHRDIDDRLRNELLKKLGKRSQN